MLAGELPKSHLQWWIDFGLRPKEHKKINCLAEWLYCTRVIFFVHHAVQFQWNINDSGKSVTYFNLQGLAFSDWVLCPFDASSIIRNYHLSDQLTWSNFKDFLQQEVSLNMFSSGREIWLLSPPDRLQFYLPISEDTQHGSSGPCSLATCTHLRPVPYCYARQC